MGRGTKTTCPFCGAVVCRGEGTMFGGSNYPIMDYVEHLLEHIVTNTALKAR